MSDHAKIFFTMLVVTIIILVGYEKGVSTFVMYSYILVGAVATVILLSVRNNK